MVRRRLWNFRDDRGTLAVEFGLMAPLFLILIMAVADFGIGALELSNVRGAARAGLQAVLSDPGDTGTAASVAETAAPLADVSVAAVCVYPNLVGVASPRAAPTGGVHVVSIGFNRV